MSKKIPVDVAPARALRVGSRVCTTHTTATFRLAKLISYAVAGTWQNIHPSPERPPSGCSDEDLEEWKKAYRAYNQRYYRIQRGVELRARRRIKDRVKAYFLPSSH